MDFWNDHDAARPKTRRRDTSKFGVARSRHAELAARLYIPKGAAKPGDRVRFIETPEGMAFKIGDKGEYRVYLQNGGTEIMLCLMPPVMNNYAPERAMSVEVENFSGGYLIPYRQFAK